jgi:hypothetical protein
VSVLDGFLATWSDALATFGQGTPETGAKFDQSGPLLTAQANVQSAAPGSTWSGTGASAYATANTEHGAVLGKVAGLDQRLSGQVNQSSEVVGAARRDLDALRQWVVDAAATVPPGKNRDQTLLPIVQNGLTQLTEIVNKSNGDLTKIGREIRALSAEYKALAEQKKPGTPEIQAVTNTKEGPVLPGQPADPADPFVGNPIFGQWETVSTSPTGPYGPLKPEYRPYPGGDPLKVGPTTGMYVPGQTWVADEDAPIVQYREGYKFRIAGTEATTITRTVNVNGQVQVQRWVANVYEYQRNTSYSAGGDFAGLPPRQIIDQTWKPISLPEIATLSATNPGTTYYLPDGCGGTVNYVGGVVENAGPPPTPIMTRPR